MNMEQLTAICINDKTERDKKIKVLGITEGKEYQVKLCRYPNYYELVNDLGNVETYFMDRFKILEGDKMEDKTIKVRCINNIDVEEKLIKDAMYTIEEEFYYSYSLKEIGSDYQFAKTRFEKVEDVLMVECVDNTGYEGHLILNKKYQVLEEDAIHYFIKNELDNKTGYLKSRFKPVEPQKEIKEYSVMELLDFPVGTKFKSKWNQIVEVKVEREESENKYLNCTWISENAPLKLSTNWIKERFTKVEEPKPVSTAEAFRALDEGKEIQSLASKCKYKKDKDIIVVKTMNNQYYIPLNLMTVKEIEGQWIIHE